MTAARQTATSAAVFLLCWALDRAGWRTAVSSFAGENVTFISSRPEFVPGS